MRRKPFVLGLGVAFCLAAVIVAFLLPRGGERPAPAPSPEHGQDLAAQIQTYEGLVRDDPENVDQRARLGELYWKRGEWERAIEQFVRAVELDPDDTRLRVRLGMIYWHRGDTARGVAELDEALRRDPSLVDVHFFKGVLLSNVAGRRGEAIAALEKVIELAPDSQFAGPAREQLAKLQGEQVPALLPARLGDLSLDDSATGREAVAAINQLHGKELAFDRGYVGSYSDGEKARSAKVWIAESKDPEALLQGMLEAIRAGHTPFSISETVEQMGGKVYLLAGMGQSHYIWARENLLIWLSLKGFAADEARAFLKDAIARIGHGVANG